MKILLTGGTGFLGRALCQSLRSQGHQLIVLSRKPETVIFRCGHETIAINKLEELPGLGEIDIVVNLAGAPIFDARWTERRKKILVKSRIDLTDRLIESFLKLNTPPKLLISGSAIGFYGDRRDELLTESSDPKSDFAHQLCSDWEQSALQAESLGTRVCLIRTGLVVDHGGGLLQRMLPLFRLGLGGKLGDGKQWMSWIHRLDWISIVNAMIANESMTGPYNATAPNPVTNEEFTRILANLLNKPTLLPVPAMLLKLSLGEMSELVLGSQRVLPQRLLDQKFTFQFPGLTNALKQSLIG